VNRLWLAILTSVALVWAESAFAATAIIARPPTPSADINEALSRLRGELLSVGLGVVIADRPADNTVPISDIRTWVGHAMGELGANAVLVIVGDDVPVAVDVWLSQTSGRFEVARVSLPPNTQNAPEMLALRTIEVLRANLFDANWAAGGGIDRPVVAPRPPDTQQEKVLSHTARLGIEIGAATVTSLDRLGTAIVPTFRAGWGARPWLVLQAAVAGAGTRPTVTTTAGSARVSQSYGLLGGSYRIRSEQRLWPFFSLSVGVLHTSIEGQATSPNDAYSADQWSFLVDGGIGTGLRLSGRYYMTLAVHVQIAAPYVAIHLADTVGATSGRPNLLLTFTLGAWL
jgi:hypothetical protein